MVRKRILVAFWTLLIAGCLTTVAHAIEGPYFARYGCGYWGLAHGPVYTPERLPYYALYPPVYYSHAVAEPYGHNPYAAVAPAPCPAVVYPMASSAAIADRPTPPPLRIVNPFVDQAKSM